MLNVDALYHEETARLLAVRAANARSNEVLFTGKVHLLEGCVTSAFLLDASREHIRLAKEARDKEDPAPPAQGVPGAAPEQKGGDPAEPKSMQCD